jgi:predicted RNA-binding Zn-ribbon protein involved in translation (DUF1610 family)
MSIKRKISGYDKHLEKCPSCGREILDHMTECPFCGKEIVRKAYHAMDEQKAKRIRVILGIILFAVVAVILVIKILPYLS